MPQKEMRHEQGVGVGAERGLGAALCRRFAVEGYHVLVAGRTPAKIAQVASTICETGGSAEPVSVDTTREEDVVRLFDRAMAPGNGCDPADVVIFNAGNNQRGSRACGPRLMFGRPRRADRPASAGEARCAAPCDGDTARAHGFSPEKLPRLERGEPVPHGRQGWTSLFGVDLWRANETKKARSVVALSRVPR